MFDVYAIKLTYGNIPAIVEAAKPLGWTLDHLMDTMEFNTEELGDDTVLYMKVWNGSTEIATFSDEPADPRSTLALTDTIDPIFGLLYKLEIN